jgi:hypothetical protein
MIVNPIILDSVKIKSIEVYNNPDDPLAVFPNSIQTLFVSGKIELLELNADKGGRTMEFKLQLGNNGLKYPGATYIFLDQKELNKFESIEINGSKGYKIIAKEFADNMKDRSFDLRFIYWSKKYGYLGLEFENGYTWKLKCFLRSEKNILQL